MSEEETNVKNHKLIKFDFLNVSLGVGFGGVVMIGMNSVICGPFGIIGLICGVISISQRKRLVKKKVSYRLPMVAIFLNLLLIVLASFSVYAQSRTYMLMRRMMCGSNLSSLGKAFRDYAEENDGEYPAPNEWCDLLLQYTQTTEKQFVCPSGGEGRCHYAMNPNCGPNSPPDMVLLFESTEGWNQFGGPELLTFENHKGEGEEGCNILFNDGHSKFVTPEELGELKWENTDHASKIKSKSLSKNRPQTLIGTWVKEKSMKEGGHYPGDKGWHLSVTFDDNGRFIWNSKRFGKDQAPVDESLTGTYSIERGFLVTYKFDKPSSISQQRLPEYFAFWPSKLIGQQTFKFHNDYLILGHDGGKLWFMLKRNDNFGYVVQPDGGESGASGECLAIH